MKLYLFCFGYFRLWNNVWWQPISIVHSHNRSNSSRTSSKAIRQPKYACSKVNATGAKDIQKSNRRRKKTIYENLYVYLKHIQSNSIWSVRFILNIEKCIETEALSFSLPKCCCFCVRVLLLLCFFCFLLFIWNSFLFDFISFEYDIYIGSKDDGVYWFQLNINVSTWAP